MPDHQAPLFSNVSDDVPPDTREVIMQRLPETIRQIEESLEHLKWVRDNPDYSGDVGDILDDNCWVIIDAATLVSPNAFHLRKAFDD